MRFPTIAVFAGFASAAIVTELELEFINYIATFNKAYATKEEYHLRFTQFATRWEEMALHAKDPTATY
jgi:hypothetical protein